jgi:hypothetical protein
VNTSDKTGSNWRRRYYCIMLESNAYLEKSEVIFSLLCLLACVLLEVHTFAFSCLFHMLTKQEMNAEGQR